MRVPDEFLQAVCFVGIKRLGDGAERFEVGGTGFFVSVDSVPYPEGLQYIYFVTAKHNIERASRAGSPLFLRINRRDGRIAYVEVRDEWFYHENPASDVAVLRWPFPNEVLETKSFPEKIFATDQAIENVNLGIGDELVIVGLFSQRHGSARNHPIVRRGTIAAMPGEPFRDDSGHEYHAYLAEVRSIGGLSGSPVIAELAPLRPAAHRPPQHPFESVYYLLGIIRGHWDLKKQEGVVDFVDDELDQVNMGIAIVTPVQDLMVVLHGEELTRMRKKGDREYEREYKKTPPPTEPSETDEEKK